MGALKHKLLCKDKYMQSWMKSNLMKLPSGFKTHYLMAKSRDKYFHKYWPRGMNTDMRADKVRSSWNDERIPDSSVPKVIKSTRNPKNLLFFKYIGQV